jgi:thiosulfate dehydrogenase
MWIHPDQLTPPRGALFLLVMSMGCAPIPPDADAERAAAVATAVLPELDFPAGPLGASAQRGRAILAHTRDSLPANVGNDLRCTSCHLDDGRRPNAMPWIGVTARFPQYRSRSGSVQRLEDRINDCFRRSLAGTALRWDDPAMRDIISYMALLSEGIAHGSDVPGQGLPLGSPTPGDSVAGAQVYATECARCHGSNGEGTPGYPPVWGPRSYTIGAGMARLRTVAAFVRHNMPFDRAGTLSEAQAQDVATYLTTRPRPDFAAKAEDWPNGDPPPDVAYPTQAGRVARP